MKRVDRLILGELLGPWLFGVAIFTVLIMAGSFLFQFTRLLSEGVPFPTVAWLSTLLLPGIIAKTFPMAMLLGTLLAFGRLSGDSEIVALRAAGVSMPRIVAPVAVMGAAVSLATFLLTDWVVPWSSLQATALQDDLTRAADKRREQSTAVPLFEDDRLVGSLFARDFRLGQRLLTGVTINGFGPDGRVQSVLEIDRLQFDDINKWRIMGPATLRSLTNNSLLKLQEGAWPNQVTALEVTPNDLLARRLRDLDALSSREISDQISKMQRDPAADRKQVINLEFGFWNKFAVPLAALVFGLVGAPLGIRNHRAGTATGFWMSVILIFVYMLITNMLAIMAQNGIIPAWLASFGPVGVGLLAAIELIRRKNLQ